ERIPEARSRERHRLLAAPRAPVAARGGGDDRGDPDRRRSPDPERHRPAARRWALVAALRQQLAPDLHPPVVLPVVRAPVPVQASVVPLRGGAVLPAVAAP